MCGVSSSSSQVRSWWGLGLDRQSGRSSALESDSFGNHRIIATSADDIIRAREEVSCGMRWMVIDVNDDRYRIPLTGPRAARSIAIDAGAGNDAVFVDPGVHFPLFINGGAGDDYLKGGSGPNALLGGTGNDTLIGGSSDDLLLGGGGSDVIHTGAGRDMTSVPDLFRRLREGWCERPVLPSESAPEAETMPPCGPNPLPPPVATQPQPQFVPAPVPQPTARPQPQPQAPVTPPPPPKPFVMPKPRLSDLLAAVDTHDEKGFKSGRTMTKNLLTALYQGPDKFRQALSSISGEGERDDAIASFTRALLDAGPGGAKMFRDIPASEKKAMADYLGAGNCWNAQKKGLMLVLSKATGAWDHNFGGDAQAQDYVRRYAGVI